MSARYYLDAQQPRYIEMTVQEKGKVLEDAVERIESLILKSKPSLADLPITIESRKIIISDGVRHEIDLYIEIDHGHEYKSIFIFECKNWVRPVDKNEVIIFSEKIRTLRAQIGFFVANDFSKDAEAQAEKDDRLQIVKSRYDEALISEFPDFHSIERLQNIVAIQVFEFGAQNQDFDESQPLEMEKSVVFFEGEKYNLEEHVKVKVEELIKERLDREPTATWPDGSYDMEYHASEDFEKGQLMLDDHSIETLKYCISFRLRVRRPKLKYAFDIEGRGKVIQFVGTLDSGKELIFTMAFQEH